MELLEWPIESAELASPAVQNRNSFARKYSTRPIADIYQTYTKYGPDQLDRLIRTAEKYVLRSKLRGTGVELGAGTGVLSCLLARRSDVHRMYAVEYVPDVVRVIQPRIIEDLLPSEKRSKVVRVIGSFDTIDLPDKSVDFAIEIASWHHSNSLDQSVAEAYRVIRDGGCVVGFDRFQPDHLSYEDIESLLEKEYDSEFLRRFGYPTDQRLTRRMNGEHEYRRGEWMAAFEKAGFRVAGIEDLERSADNPLNSLRRLARKDEKKVRGLATPKRELKNWVRQLFRNAPYAPARMTCFALVKGGR